MQLLKTPENILQKEPNFITDNGELKKYNQIFIDQIEKAKDTNTLLKIWEEMKKRSFLNYNVDIKKQDEHIEDFKTAERTPL